MASVLEPQREEEGPGEREINETDSRERKENLGEDRRGKRDRDTK